MPVKPHAVAPADVLENLDVDAEGLTDEQVRRRRAEHGENEIVGGSGRSPLAIFVAQFDSVLIYVLLAAAVLSLWAGHSVDAVLIGIIVVANGVFGFVQDYRAEQSLQSLREMAAPAATVRRAGDRETVEATALVPGDVILLSGGDVVPADARLLEDHDLEADEAALTGESVPVSKDVAPLDPGTPLADRTNMVHKGTNVTRGTGVAVVTATGMETAVGDIATELVTTAETDTPLQSELDTLGRMLGLGVLVLSALVAPLLLLRGTEPVQAGLAAVSLAVAAVPEGLPAVVTLTLALGVHQLSDEQALVRRLPAVEALGAVDVVCTDKTGTLTRGQMTVSTIWLADGVRPVGSAREETPRTDTEAELWRGAVLCNDATREEGDPTERALLEGAERRGIDIEARRRAQPRTGEVPFSSERKWMGTLHGDLGYVKGAPEVVVDRCEWPLTDDGLRPLTDEDRERIDAAVGEFGDDPLRE